MFGMQGTRLASTCPGGNDRLAGEMDIKQANIEREEAPSLKLSWGN